MQLKDLRRSYPGNIVVQAIAMEFMKIRTFRISFTDFRE